MTRHSRAVAWLSVLVWCGVIFWFSSIPSLSTGLGIWDLILRKGAHVTEYAILMILLLRTRIPAWLAFVIGVLYASSDEWHQTFVEGREGRPRDVLIDSIGLLIGLWAWFALTRRRRAS